MFRLPTKATLKKYGMTELDWLAILTAQQGVCANCKKAPRKKAYYLNSQIVCPTCHMLAIRVAVAERHEQERQDVLTTGLVKCAKCLVDKPLSDYPTSRRNRKGAPRYSYCKPCHSESQRILRLKKLFNITVEDYDTVLKQQGGVCAICKQLPKATRLAVDHDHQTGLIRGLLCPWCNRAIGLFRDNLERFKNTVSYLSEPPATTALGSPRFGLKGRTTNKAKTRDRLNRIIK